MTDITSKNACPENVLLRALLDGGLPAEQQATIQAHVDHCSVCEATLKQMTVGGESWIGMAASLKERDERTDGPLAAAMERLKTDDGSSDGEHEQTDPQRTLDFLQPADDPKLLGKLGQHEITEVIGWGGMGVVLKAYDPSLHRVVAVKVLASHLAYHAVARKRFIREAQAAAAVCHDNVVTIHAIDTGLGEPEGVSPRTSDVSAVRGLTPSGSPMNHTLPKIIMQFVAGGSLQERIDQEAPLELKEILRIAMQTAAGLAAAHAQGVVHRDVKPANILLENGVQRVKLTDFGLARVMDDASLTLSGVIAGTPQYMAPEQAWGRDVDARADLFSLGAVMYAMCSGHSPFRARTTMAVLKRVCESAPRPLRAINPDVPSWLVAIIEKLLAKNADERFQTATEVSELLGRWLAHVQQPNVVSAPSRLSTSDDKRSINPGEPESVSSRTSGETSFINNEPGNVRGLTPSGSPGSLSAKAVLFPMVGIGVAVAVMMLLVAADQSQNVPSFVGFSAWNLLVTFALGAAFRAAWNTSSWFVWVGAIVFLPAVGSAFLVALSEQSIAAAAVLIFGVQSLTAFVLLFGLLFVRPFFVRSSERWMRERLTGWQRLFAIACFTIIGTPLTLAVMYWLASSFESQRQTAFIAPQPATLTITDPAVIINRDEPQRPLGSQAFPKPQLLSGEKSIASSPSGPMGSGGSPVLPDAPEFEIEPIYEPVLAVRRIPKRTPAAVAESLMPLQGRWVVLTLQGDEPPEVGTPGFGGGPGGMGSAMAAAPMSGGSSSSVVTPTQGDQLRFLEFRNGLLILNDEPQRQMSVSIQNDRELNFANGSGQSVWHGVFTIADDRLVICWTSGNQPLPRGFQPKSHEQLVVCRREWSRPISVNEKGNAAVAKFDENSKLPKAEMPFSPREAAALQAAWAEKSKSPVEVTNSVGMKLRVIPPGSFGDPRTVATLGQSVGGASVEQAARLLPSPDHSQASRLSYVAISGPILVGTHEVTVAQFRQFIDDSKYVTEVERSENGQLPKQHSWRKPEIEQGSDQHPVVHVSFEDALAFCHWLSLKEKKPYRLLTRREWEFCARAGSWLPVTLGPGKLAYRSQFFTTTASVGSYAANSFGLHDFIGNVAEWAWHNDIPPEDARRWPTPGLGMGAIGSDPTIFCGGDFRQHINRSQPSEWQHQNATTTLPTIGFRVGVDLTPSSVVSLPKYWPMNQLVVSKELVRVRTLENSTPKSDDNKADGAKTEVLPAPPNGRLNNAVWLEMLVRTEQMPYVVEWLDFEIERRTSPKDEDVNQFLGRRAAEAGAEEGWKPIDLTPALRLLEQTEFAPDPIAAPFLNPVLTMPIPKAVSGQWTSPDKRQGLLTDFVRLESVVQKPQLFRFIDFHVPHGAHRYRVRLKYRAPSITPETVQTTSWFVSLSEAEIDIDYVPPNLPEKIPVIELKPLPPTDPAAPPLEPGSFRKLRRP